jgi:peptide/nickel transport system substrate-binding protein
VTARARVSYLVALALGLVAVLATALALGHTDSSASEYVEGVVGRPTVVDPLLAEADVERDLAALIFNGLLRVGPDGLPELDLAERWDVTPDGRTYTVVLREGLTWHDGRAVTTEDVLATYEAIQDPQFSGSSALVAQWSGVRLLLVDERTLVLHLDEPSAGFLTRLAVGIRPAHEADGVVGTGPYRLVELDSDEAVLERNTSYHRGSPALSRVRLRFFDDEGALTRALDAGDLDGALLSETAASTVGVNADLVADDLTRNAYTLLYLNNASPPLDDPALRRALIASLDRAQLQRLAIGERGLPGESVFVPASWAAPESVAVERAGAGDLEALWLEAGWSLDEERRRVRDGRVLRLRLATNIDPLRETLAEVVAAQLSAQGLTVDIEMLPASELLASRLRPRDFDLAIFGWEPAVDPDPYGGWHTSQVSLDGQNIAGFSDPIADALLEVARVTLDVNLRREFYADFLARFEHEAASLVLFYPVRTYLRPPRLVAPDPGLLFEPASRFALIEEWRFGEG